MTTPAEHIAFIKRFLEACVTADPDEFAGYFTDDAVWWNAPWQAIEGRAAIGEALRRGTAQMTARPWELRHIAAEGHVVFTERVDHFLVGETHISVPCMGIFELRDGRIAAWRDYWDLRQFERQLPTRPAEPYLGLALREFLRHKALAERAMAQVTTDQFFARSSPEDNSIAVIVKHLGGNMCSRWRDFLTTDGEKPERNRDGEFITEADSREGLLAQWEQGWAMMRDALTPLGPADLDRTVTIRGESFTVLQAINRQLTHAAYHVGQIVFLAKHFAGDNWSSLSIPKGQSARFNQAPARYL